MANIAIPLKVSRRWNIDRNKIFCSIYKYDTTKIIFKFAYQPLSGELIFDTAGIHHDTMILNNGKGKFNDYIRGICFWQKKVVYLRGHNNAQWLQATKAMLRKNGVSVHYRVIWGIDAATELETELRGL